MSKHKVGTREEWLAKRIELLEAEKELTRLSDKLAEQRQEMPWVLVDKNYQFETEAGTTSLKELFGNRSQLIVYHFMYGSDYKAGCPSCSSIADGFNGIYMHLQNHDVAFTAISRAPLSTLTAYKKRMNWTFPWASSNTSDFNNDYNVTFTESEQADGSIVYNYRNEKAFVWRPGKEGGGEAVESEFAKTCGVDTPTYHRERPGLSTFAIQDDKIYHAYSAYARGVDSIWLMYQWLDRAPLGRNENGGLWFKRHDEYGK